MIWSRRQLWRSQIPFIIVMVMKIVSVYEVGVQWSISEMWVSILNLSSLTRKNNKSEQKENSLLTLQFCWTFVQEEFSQIPLDSNIDIC